MNKKKSKKAVIIIGVLLLLAIIIVLFSIGMNKTSAQSYKEITAEKKSISTYYKFNGNIEAKNKQNVVATTILQISKINVKQGDKVKKDDVLFETTQSEQIKAEIDGEVASVLAVNDEVYEAGTKLATVTNYDKLQVSIKVDEYDVPSIAKDMDVTIYVNALDKQFNGKISNVSKEATTNNGMSYFNVVAELDGSEGLLVGMSAEVRLLHKSSEDAIVVPMEALKFNEDNEAYVYYKGSAGEVLTKKVVVGINDGTNVEIKEGIAEGETILVPQKEISTSSASV